jgi:hypothetical protein
MITASTYTLFLIRAYMKEESTLIRPLAVLRENIIVFIEIDQLRSFGWRRSLVYM